MTRPKGWASAATQTNWVAVLKEPGPYSVGVIWLGANRSPKGQIVMYFELATAFLPGWLPEGSVGVVFNPRFEPPREVLWLSPGKPELDMVLRDFPARFLDEQLRTRIKSAFDVDLPRNGLLWVGTHEGESLFGQIILAARRDHRYMLERLQKYSVIPPAVQPKWADAAD